MHFSKEGTLLHIAAMTGRPEVIQVLISHGADINAVIDDGYKSHRKQPLDLAMTSFSVPSMSLLLSLGAKATCGLATVLKMAIKQHWEPVLNHFISGFPGVNYLLLCGGVLNAIELAGDGLEESDANAQVSASARERMMRQLLRSHRLRNSEAMRELEAVLNFLVRHDLGISEYVRRTRLELHPNRRHKANLKHAIIRTESTASYQEDVKRRLSIDSRTHPVS